MGLCWHKHIKLFIFFKSSEPNSMASVINNIRDSKIYLWLSSLLLNTSLQVMHKRKETKDMVIAKTDNGGRKDIEPSV